MSRKTKYLSLVIVLLSVLAGGCGNAAEKRVQTKNQTQPLIVPRYELIETQRYKELKLQVEETRDLVAELERRKIRLSVRYSEEHASVKEISNQLKETKRVLAEDEMSLAEETERLEKRVKNPPV